MNQSTWMTLSKWFPDGIAGKMISLDQDYSFKPTSIVASPACLYLVSAGPSIHPHRLYNCIPSPMTIYWTFKMLVDINKDLICTTPWLTNIENWKCSVMPSSCLISHHRCKYNRDVNPTSTPLGWEHWYGGQPICRRDNLNLIREDWRNNTTER